MPKDTSRYWNITSADDSSGLLGDGRKTRHIEQMTKLSNYRGHSVRSRNGTRPNLLTGGSNITISNGEIFAGAMCAVAGKQKFNFNAHKREGGSINFTTSPVPADTSAHGAYPSVLHKFKGVLPAAEYGMASFSAVGGKRIVNGASLDIVSNSAPISHTEVLPNRAGTDFPEPVNGKFEEGQYSVVANDLDIAGGEGPSVLRDFEDLHAHNVRFLPGSFAVVGEDQIIELYNE